MCVCECKTHNSSAAVIQSKTQTHVVLIWTCRGRAPVSAQSVLCVCVSDDAVVFISVTGQTVPSDNTSNYKTFFFSPKSPTEVYWWLIVDGRQKHFIMNSSCDTRNCVRLKLKKKKKRQSSEMSSLLQKKSNLKQDRFHQFYWSVTGTDCGSIIDQVKGLLSVTSQKLPLTTWWSTSYCAQLS